MVFTYFYRVSFCRTTESVVSVTIVNHFWSFLFSVSDEVQAPMSKTTADTRPFIMQLSMVIRKSWNFCWPTKRRQTLSTSRVPRRYIWRRGLAKLILSDCCSVMDLVCPMLILLYVYSFYIQSYMVLSIVSATPWPSRQ